MNISIGTLLCIVFISIGASSVFGIIIQQKYTLRHIIQLSFAIVAFIATLYMNARFLNGEQYDIRLLSLWQGVGLRLMVDAPALIFSQIAIFLWICAIIYSHFYMSHYDKHKTAIYDMWYQGAMIATIGVAFSGSLITILIFFEILTFCTYPLVIYYGDINCRRAGKKYLVYTIMAGQCLLLALVIIFGYTKNLDFVLGGLNFGAVNSAKLLILFFLASIGGLTKAAVMPFHSWLPSAMVAPTPVSGLLHAVAVVNSGVFVLARIIYYVFGMNRVASFGGDTLLVTLGSITILVGGLVALRQKMLKRVLAYSTICQMSYMVMAMGFATNLGLSSSLAHLLTHSIIKLSLFMLAGIIISEFKLEEVRFLYKLPKRANLYLILFAISSLSMIGLPGTPGFVSKVEIFKASLDLGWIIPVAIMGVSSILSTLYLLVIPMSALKNRDGAMLDKANLHIDMTKIEDKSCKYFSRKKPLLRREGGMTIPVLILIMLGIVIGIYPNLIFSLEELTSHIGGGL